MFYVPVVAGDDLVALAIRRIEGISQLLITAEDAAESTSAIQELQRVLSIDHIEAPALITVVLGEIEKVFEQLVLSDGLRTALPVDELELRHTTVGFEIEWLARIASPEGDVTDSLARLKNMRQ